MKTKTLDTPSLLRGAARLLDLGSAISTYKHTPPVDHSQTAYGALHQAWCLVGNGLRTAIEAEIEDNPLLTRDETPTNVTHAAPADASSSPPPYSVEAEQSVLGSLLLDRDAIIPVSEVVRPEDFYVEAHRLIYGVIYELYERRQPADFITLSDELERRDLTDRVGGRGYLPSLAATVPTVVHAQAYADIVARLAVLRRLIETVDRDFEEATPASRRAVSPIKEQLQRDVDEAMRCAGALLAEDVSLQKQVAETGAKTADRR